MRTLLDSTTLGRTMPRAVSWMGPETIRLELGAVGGGQEGPMSPGDWQVQVADGSCERGPSLPSTPATTPPQEHAAPDTPVDALPDGTMLFLDRDGRLRRAASPLASEALQESLADPQLVFEAFRIEEFHAHENWVVICSITPEWGRRLHLVRLDTGMHYELGPGCKPRWGRSLRK